MSKQTATAATKPATARKGNTSKGKKVAPAAVETLVTEETATVETVTSEPVAPVKTFSQRLIEALTLRNADAPSKDNDISISAAKKGARTIDALHANPAWEEVCESLVRAAPVTDKKDSRFIAVKTMVKVCHALVAIGSGVRSEFDPYSRTLIANLASLSGLHNKSALVALSKSVVYDELDQQQALVQHYNCSASTASTQASSTRMMLRALGVCEVNKGKQGDVTKTLENERCTQVLAMFAVK